VPLIVAWGALHDNPVGAPAIVHEILTAPVKPFPGVTVSVEVPLLPAVTLIFPLLLSVNDGLGGAAVTVIETVTEEVTVPVASSLAVTVAV